MEEAKFKLPGSSLKELEKIIEAYGLKAGPVSNEDVAKLAGLNPTTISRNNGFLVATGLISGGKKKKATDLGAKLGRALHHNEQTDAGQFWREAVSQNAVLSEQLTSIRVQKGVKEEELPGKLLYNLGASKASYTEAGARAVVEILLASGLLKKEDGVLQVPAADETTVYTPPTQEPEHGESAPPPVASIPAAPPPAVVPQPFQLAINLQLQLPEFEDPQKYEQLFAALRKNLLTPDGT